MVLSTDGIFQDLTNQQVVDVVSRYLAEQDTANSSKGWMSSLFGGGGKNSGKHAPNAASALIKQSLTAAVENTLGRGITDSDNAARMDQILSLQAGKPRRRVHDDNTVIVLFFDHERPIILHGEKRGVDANYATLQEDVQSYVDSTATATTTTTTTTTAGSK
jgi:hypothetical protein